MPFRSGTGRSAKERRPDAAAAIRRLVTSGRAARPGCPPQSIENKKGRRTRSRPASFSAVSGFSAVSALSAFSAPSARSEIELRAELEEARLQHVGRTQVLARRQRRERVGHREWPVAVEDVVGVEVDAEPVAIELEPLRRPQVELLQILCAVLGARLNHADDLARGPSG